MFSLYATIIHNTMTEHNNNHVTMNFTIIMSQFACASCGPIGNIILYEVARTYQSYRPLILIAYSDAKGSLLVCRALDS